MALRMNSLALSSPPISSTIRSISGSLIRSMASTVKLSLDGVTGSFRSDSISRSAIFFTTTSAPTRSVIISRFVVRTSKVPAPTVPNPIMPTLISDIAPSQNLQNLPDSPYSLSGTLRVFHQGKTDVIITVLPKSDSGRYSHLGLIDKKL